MWRAGNTNDLPFHSCIWSPTISSRRVHLSAVACKAVSVVFCLYSAPHYWMKQHFSVPEPDSRLSLGYARLHDDLCKGPPGPVRAVVHTAILNLPQILWYISAGNVDAAIVTSVCINYSMLTVRLQRTSQIFLLQGKQCHGWLHRLCALSWFAKLSRTLRAPFLSRLWPAGTHHLLLPHQGLVSPLKLSNSALHEWQILLKFQSLQIPSCFKAKVFPVSFPVCSETTF